MSELKNNEEYFAAFLEIMKKSESDLFNTCEGLKCINSSIYNDILYIGINYSIKYPPERNIDNFFYNLSSDKDFYVKFDPIEEKVSFFQDDKLIFEELAANSPNMPKKCLIYIKDTVEKDLNSWKKAALLKAYAKKHILKKLKKDNPVSLKKLRMKFEPYKIITLKRECLPVILICGETKFDLSFIPNPHLTEIYEKELIAAIENKQLKVELKTNNNDVQKNKAFTKKRL